MKINNEFEIKKEGDTVVLLQKVTKIMDGKEAIKNVKGLETEIMQLRQKELELNKAISEDRITKDLNQITEQIETLDGLKTNWENVIKDDVEKFKSELKGKIKVLKAEAGYDRISKKDMNSRIAKANEILAKVIVDNEVERNDPIILELRKDFDGI